MDTALAVGGILVGVAGVVLTIYFAKKAERLNRLRKRLEWTDLQTAANDLGQRIKKECPPAAIVTPGLTGATFVNLLVGDFPLQPPVFVGTRTWKENAHGPIPNNGSFLIETKKWLVTVPKAVTEYKDGIVLIVDDFAMSGDFLDALRNLLTSEGVPFDNIRSATIAVTKVAIRNHKAPDYYWWLADDDDFYFPWGKAK